MATYPVWSDALPTAPPTRLHAHLLLVVLAERRTHQILPHRPKGQRERKVSDSDKADSGSRHGERGMTQVGCVTLLTQ